MLATKFLLAILLIGFSTAALVGQWNFNSLLESTGYWGQLQLQGSASLSNGGIRVTGSGTTSTARGYCTGYTGPHIYSKSLVTWVYFWSFNAYAGSGITIDTTNIDQFDGAIFGEVPGNGRMWSDGSNNCWRCQTPQMTPGYVENTLGIWVNIIITYDWTPSNIRMRTYRNGAQIGDWTSTYLSDYQAGTAEMWFGARHSYLSMSDIRGAIDATIGEGRLYSHSLSASEIATIAGYTGYLSTYCCPSVQDQCDTISGECASMSLTSLNAACSADSSFCAIRDLASDIISICNSIASNCQAEHNSSC